VTEVTDRGYLSSVVLLLSARYGRWMYIMCHYLSYCHYLSIPITYDMTHSVTQYANTYIVSLHHASLSIIGAQCDPFIKSLVACTLALKPDGFASQLASECIL